MKHLNAADLQVLAEAGEALAQFDSTQLAEQIEQMQKTAPEVIKRAGEALAQFDSTQFAEQIEQVKKQIRRDKGF